ncbi:HWE histidine kinase domain-containing protein [Phenylobacterium sp.]|uniref:sensor histidine kinase n=1 Tax=Phenylobacterium sp. TaxID=1871053 RepID=UPI0025F6F86A|nr:HWE histidine kinase domain-containing protein [Phenylobacterium sp.]MBX3484577.1 PAS domain-containing protein [Phenylobacterium sp.]
MAATRRDRTQPAGLAVELGKALLDIAGADGLFAADAGGRLTYCNPAAARFLQTFRTSTIGKPLRPVLARLGGEAMELRFLTAIRDLAPVEFVTPRPGADDEWVEVRGLPVEGGIAFFLRDVTDRERGERTLRRNERRLRAMTESLRLAHQAARAATWEWRAGGALRWLDPAAARALVGLSASSRDEEAIADWRTFVFDDDKPAVAEALGKLREADEATFEYRVSAADGGHRWLRSSAAVVERRPDGAAVRVSGVTVDVTANKLYEARLEREVAERARAERRQQLLIHELNHRVKNMLATVQSVARQSLGRAKDGGPLADFEDRLMALAWTHDILTRERWAGASLRAVLQRTMAPHAGGERVTLAGPDLRISPKMALALAMGGHELATNAVKYGALSNEKGRVSVRWRLDPETDPARLIVDWQELGGPRVEPPKARGFGSRLLERGLAHELGGEVKIAFERPGVRCRISAPFQPEPGPAPDDALDDPVFGPHTGPENLSPRPA